MAEHSSDNFLRRGCGTGEPASRFRRAGGTQKQNNDRTMNAKNNGLTAIKHTSGEALDENTKLSAKDQKFLQAREQIIAAGLKTFYSVGQALVEIRNYRNGILIASYGTFENYCLKKWGIRRAHAHRLMDATTTVTEIKNATRGKVALPVSERQLRPLTKLSSAKSKAAAWKEAIDLAGSADKVTGELVNKVVSDRQGGKANKPRHGIDYKAKFRKNPTPREALRDLRATLTAIRRRVSGDTETVRLVGEAQKLLKFVKVA